MIYQPGAGYLYHKRFNTLDMAGMGHTGVHLHLKYDKQYGIATCLRQVIELQCRNSRLKTTCWTAH